MNKGLLSTLVRHLVKIFNSHALDHDLQLKLAIVNSLSIAFNLSDVIDELDADFFAYSSILE